MLHPLPLGRSITSLLSWEEEQGEGESGFHGGQLHLPVIPEEAGISLNLLGRHGTIVPRRQSCRPLGRRLAGTRWLFAQRPVALGISWSGRLLLPGASRTAGIRFCCPVRPEPRFCPM